MVVFLYLCTILFSCSTLYPEDPLSIGTTIKDTATTAGSGIASAGKAVGSAATDVAKAALSSGIGKQLSEGFGYCPSTFTYSMQVWNDLPIPIDAYLIGVVQVQGGGFSSTSYAHQCAIPAYTASGTTNFLNTKLCHGIVNFYAGQQSCPGQPSGSPFYSRPQGASPQARGEQTASFPIFENDNGLYTYHTFQTSETDGPEGEFMGPGMYGGPYIMTPDFDGVFFNHSPYQAELSFKKNGQTYTVALESLSFNLLSSDSWQPDSVRSSTEDRSFGFKVNAQQFTVPIQGLGLGDTFYDPSSSTTQTIPLTYTYEIYKKQNDVQVSIQGFNMGNHHQLGILDIASSTTPQPSSLAALRDINPIDCYAWIQSAAQYQANQDSSSNNQPSNQIPYEGSGSLWATYQTTDWKIVQQLTAGDWKSNHFQIIRPQVKESLGNLFIFSLDTSDSQKASQFFTNLPQSADLPNSILSTSITGSQIPSTLATQLLPNTNGIINDPQSGVTGTLLLVDNFIPYGGGNKASRYYQVPPALLQVDSSFASIITSYLDPSLFNSDKQQAQTMMLADFRQNIAGWLTTFNQNSSKINAGQINLSNVSSYSSQLSELVPELTTYLQSKGLSSLFTDPSQSEDRTFSPQGLKALYLIFFGPLSLNSPPLIQRAGSNAYLGLEPGQLPKGWPTD